MSEYSLPKTQLAYRFSTKTNKIFKTNVDVPIITDNQVLVEVVAAGLCHTDLHYGEKLMTFEKDFTVGHEIAGIIRKVGSKVARSDLKLDGTHYAVLGINPCTNCITCLNGFNNICPHTVYSGIGRDGGLQKFVACDPATLVEIPAGVSPEVAAASTDAVLTPYHALKNSGVSGIDKVLIIGLGGLGLHAVQVAKYFGAYVVAYDLKEESVNYAFSIGANEAYTKLPSDSINASVVMDIVGIGATSVLAQKHVALRGKILPLGLGSGTANYDLYSLVFKEISVVGTLWGTIQDLIEVLQLVSEGRIKPIVKTIDFDDVEEGYKAMSSGKVFGRLAAVYK